MEKWLRGLSKPTALILGTIGIALVIFVFAVSSTLVSGLIPMIILGGILGGGVGFSVQLLYKGFTGYTPQEKKQLKQKP